MRTFIIPAQYFNKVGLQPYRIVGSGIMQSIYNIIIYMENADGLESSFTNYIILPTGISDVCRKVLASYPIGHLLKQKLDTCK